jgi:hypothetical protein
MIWLTTPNLRNLQLQFANPRTELPRLAAIAVTPTLLAPLMKIRPKLLVNLLAHQLLTYRLQKKL